MPDNATILIKKSDGTSERISLAEFRARQKKTAAPPVAPPVKEITPIKIEKKSEPVKSFAAPIDLTAKKVAPETKKSEFTKSDAASLLEEPLAEEKSNAPLASQSRISQADEIINKLSFRASDMIRLRGLIQLRLKDIRSEEETRTWLIRSTAEGGAGINAMQADEVLKLCRGGKISKSVDEIQPLKKGLPGELVTKADKKSSPIVYKEQPVPAVIQAKKSFVTPPPVKELKDLAELKNMSGKDVSADKQIPSVRPIVQDIVPSKRTSVSPTDEIRFISLVDFRRLSANPAEAMSRLKQKFINLKDESYLLYLEALAAWRMSPLYQDYIGSVTQALNQNTRLNSLLTDKNKIQMAEIGELIKMENGF